MRTLTRFLLTLVIASQYATAAQVKDLEYGGILFDYYQQDYFSALVQYEYANSQNALQHTAMKPGY